MNYIILFPDELRAESLGCYGGPAKTPNIDRLAAEGTRFAQNYTEHPVCGPARACLATGWYPHIDGRRTYYPLKANHVNLYTPLRRAGFTVAHAAKDDMFDAPGMDLVFDEHLPFHRGDLRAMDLHAVPEARYSMLYPPVPDAREPELADARSTQDAIDFIARHAHAGKPFCLTLAWLFPHPPYTCPESYYNMYAPDSVPQRGPDWMQGKPDYLPLLRKYREMEGADPAIYRKIGAVYLGMISYIDALVGRIVEALKANGIYDETTIFFCSDHGDFAGDAGQLEKWPSDMSEMLTHVPLIIRRPGCPAGQVVRTPTQSFDILPTILDYEHIDPGYAHFGVSLRPQVEGAPGDTDRAVYCEGGYDTWEPWCFEPACFAGTAADHPMPEGSDYYPKCRQQQERPDSVCRVVMQRWGDWKLCVRTNGQNELYNLKGDPQEYHNRYFDPACTEIRQAHEQRMLRWLIGTSDVVPVSGR